MDGSWSKERGAVYRWIKGGQDPAITMMSRDDGSLTADVGEMDETVTRAWTPIMRKCAEPGSPEPEVDPFMAKFGRHIMSVPMVVSELTGEGLRKRMMKMNVKTATSTDGWAVVDLRVLPAELWNMLAELLQAVEDTGVWPRSLAEGFMALVPKGEGTGPLQMRPLSVLSMVYRIWAGFRLQDAMKW